MLPRIASSSSPWIAVVAMLPLASACAATPVEDPHADQLGRPALVYADMAHYVVNGVTETETPATDS